MTPTTACGSAAESHDYVMNGVQFVRHFLNARADAELIAHAPEDIATLLAHVDRLRDLAAALEAEVARVSAICTAHGIDPDGCTDCFVATTADLSHPPVTHQGKKP